MNKIKESLNQELRKSQRELAEAVGIMNLMERAENKEISSLRIKIKKQEQGYMKLKKAYNSICDDLIRLQEVKEGEVIDVSGQKIEIIKDLTERKKDAFVYLDPPYYPVAKTKDGKISPYKLYNGNDWVPVDFLKLKLRCDDLTNNKIPFVLSNSDCEFIRILFKDYCMVELDEVRVMKQGKEKNSRPKDKCLIITNFKQKEDFMKAISSGENR